MLITYKLFNRTQEVDDTDAKALYAAIIEKLLPHESRMSIGDSVELRELVRLLVVACNKEVNDAFFENQEN